MMMISILLSFQDRGGDLAHATSKGSVAFFFTVRNPVPLPTNCISDRFIVHGFLRHDCQLYTMVSTHRILSTLTLCLLLCQLLGLPYSSILRSNAMDFS